MYIQYTFYCSDFLVLYFFFFVFLGGEGWYTDGDNDFKLHSPVGRSATALLHANFMSFFGPSLVSR